MKNKFAIFINSSDNTNDIANIFVIFFEKFIKNIDIKIFVGTNNLVPSFKDCEVIPIKVNKSNWKKETIEQISIIKREYEEIEYIIPILDDFAFIKEFDFKNLSSLFKLVYDENLFYLRLKKIEESIFTPKKKIKFHNQRKELIEIRNNHPYYSSLQVAIWNISHYMATLQKCENIWKFEKINLNIKHYSVCKSLLTYIHIVEKGEWDYDAKTICKKYIKLNLSNFNNRQFKKHFLKKIIFKIKKILFPVIGYHLTRNK